jgi:hypothetical protein
MKYWETIADKLSATGALFALLVFVAASAFAKSPAPEVIFISPCECQGFHGKNRWIYLKLDNLNPGFGQERLFLSVLSSSLSDPWSQGQSPREVKGNYQMKKARKVSAMFLGLAGGLLALIGMSLGGPVRTVAADETVAANEAVVARAFNNRIDFQMVRSAGAVAANCIPNAHAVVRVVSLGPVEVMTVDVGGASTASRV